MECTIGVCFNDFAVIIIFGCGGGDFIVVGCFYYVAAAGLAGYSYAAAADADAAAA